MKTVKNDSLINGRFNIFLLKCRRKNIRDCKMILESEVMTPRGK